MRIKSVGCKYFNRFGEWNEIEIPKNKKVIGIIGKYAGNEIKSNRAGKTSFVELLTYGMYGKGRTRSEANLINFNYSEDMLTRLVLEDDNGEEIVIERGRNIDNTYVFDVEGIEGIGKKDAQAELDKILGIEYKDFITTYFFMQDDIHAFMKAGSSAKKEYIIRWLEKSYWKDLEKAAKEKLDKITDAIKKNEGYLEETIKPNIKELKSQLEFIKSDKDKLELELQEYDSKMESINNKIKQIDINELEKELVQLEKDIKFQKKQVEVYRRLVNRPDTTKKIIDLANKYTLEQIENIIENLNEAYTNVKVAKTKLLTEYNLLKEKENSIKEFGGICPITENQCKEVNQSELLINLRKQMNILFKEIQDNDYDSIGREIITYKLVKKFIEYRKAKADYDRSVDELNKLTERYNEIKNKIENNELFLLNAEFEELQEKRNEIYKKYKQKIREIGSKEQEIENAKEINKKINKVKKEIVNYKKFQSYWKFIVHMFSKNGIPSLMMNEALNEVQEETNLILEKLGAPISIEFSSIKELQKLNERCHICNKLYEPREMECSECGAKRENKTKDELVLKIYESDKETDFDQDSGGGKVLISTAIRFALMRMLIRKSNSKIKFVVLDEIFGSLDQIYRKAMLDLIIDFVVNELQIEQVFIISHTDISDLIEDIIVVTRYEKYSTFSWML